MGAWRRVGFGLVGMVLMTTGCGVSTDSSSPTSLSSAAGTSTTSTPPTSTHEVTAPPLSVTESSVPTETTSVPVEVTELPAETSVVVEPPPDPEPSEAPAPPPPTSTPSPEPEPAPPVDPTGTVVVIDPGHNGANGANPSIINAPVDAGFGETKPCNTTGTSTNDGYPEHAFTWAVANNVRDLLEAQGVTVVMTRDSDDGVGPCVDRRAAIGNDSGADAVVSIHGDGAPAGDRGFYAMTAQRVPNGDAIAASSLTLATAVRDALVENDVAPSNYAGSDGLWKRDDLAGLNLSLVPTTMLELGNMRDGQDAEFMKSDAGQDLIAAGIAQGILHFLGS